MCGWGEIVDVEGDEASGEDVAFAALSVFEVASDESAYVFVVVFFGLGRLWYSVVVRGMMCGS